MSALSHTDAYRVLDFWFNYCGPEEWFGKDEAFDDKIRETFLHVYEAAKAGELEDWKETSSTCLALIIVLDQFPRNMFRGTRKAFATDRQALRYAKHLMDTGIHYSLGETERVFVFLPYEHSEDPDDQARSVKYFGLLEDKSYLEWAEKHKDVIDRFGRFPHRNAILGRETTPDEQAYLDDGGGF